jgi:hypothetical protein
LNELRKLDIFVKQWEQCNANIFRFANDVRSRRIEILNIILDVHLIDNLMNIIIRRQIAIDHSFSSERQMMMHIKKNDDTIVNIFVIQK